MKRICKVRLWVIVDRRGEVVDVNLHSRKDAMFNKFHRDLSSKDRALNKHPHKGVPLFTTFRLTKAALKAAAKEQQQ